MTILEKIEENALKYPERIAYQTEHWGDCPKNAVLTFGNHKGGNTADNPTQR